MSAKAKKTLKGNRSGTDPVLLSELIEAVKADLLESAERKPKDFVPLFHISEATIETEVTAERKTGVDGKTGIYLVTVGTSGQQTNVTKHKVALKLAPIGKAEELPPNSPLFQGSKSKKKKDKASK